MKKIITKNLLLAIIFQFLLSVISNAQDSIIRKPLLKAELGTITINKVDVREITLAAGLIIPLHKHPGPVTGYIVEGTVKFQIKDEPVKILHAGDAFYEPAGTEITHFDNASAKKPLKIKN
jgi:quercetin dioxygenase-like cupin family protein